MSTKWKSKLNMIVCVSFQDLHIDTKTELKKANFRTIVSMQEHLELHENRKLSLVMSYF